MDIRKFGIERVNIKHAENSEEKLKVNNYVEKKKNQSLLIQAKKGGSELSSVTSTSIMQI